MIKFPELRKFLVDHKSNLKTVLKVINNNANNENRPSIIY